MKTRDDRSHTDKGHRLAACQIKKRRRKDKDSEQAKIGGQKSAIFIREVWVGPGLPDQIVKKETKEILIAASIFDLGKAGGDASQSRK